MNPDQRIAAFQAFVAKSPDDAFARYSLAMALRAAGRLEEAAREFDENARREGLIPDWDVASLIGKRMADGLKRLQLVEIIKDLKGWKAPDGKYNMFEVPRPNVTGQNLRDAGYVEAGKSIRWLNYVLPTGAEIEAYVHPDIAREFKYLYDGGRYGNFSKAYRKFQGTVKNTARYKGGFCKFAEFKLHPSARIAVLIP